MTRDDIINLAREAGCEETWGADAFRFGEVELERFVAIIAAAEREACAEMCDVYAANDPQNFADICAAAIRARGNT